MKTKNDQILLPIVIGFLAIFTICILFCRLCSAQKYIQKYEPNNHEYIE